MLRTLYGKLAAVLILLLVAIGLLYALISTSAIRHYLQEVSQHFNRDLARNLVADRNLVAEGRIDEEALKETFHQYMVINPSIEIYLLDLEGRILAFSADPGKVKRKRVSLEPIRAFLRGDQAYPLLGDDPRSHDRRKAFSVTPVPSTQSPEGYLYVVLRGEEYDSVESLVRDSYFLRLSGWAVAASLVFGLLAGLVLFHFLTRRLRRLSDVMEQFQRSDFAAHLPYLEGRGGSEDEVDRLGRTFDRMAQRISAQFEALKDQDRLRRELVAQVSHDLRTPLASLNGYLESLQMKEPDLSPQERGEYLGVALRQSERLTRLVEELFELARLDAQETPPRREPFAPAELVQDVLQKFRLAAQSRDVELVMDADPELPFVSADIGMTERVLENLIENALGHTPAGGRVEIAVAAVEGRMAFTVADSGSGIAAEDQPHVFDAFYRSSGSDRSAKHAGLGLAIARRIVELHQGEIRVASRPGQGARFTFFLPLLDVPGR